MNETPVYFDTFEEAERHYEVTRDTPATSSTQPKPVLLTNGDMTYPGWVVYVRSWGLD